jgi:uncharacterized protein YsxB (DUF464 family)
MITATAVVDTDLCLVQLDVNGHAEYSKTGTDIVCSAVSVLTRTAGRILLSRLEEKCDFVSNGKGSFELNVLEVPYGRREWMMGITEYLLNGLSDLEKEFPAQVKLEITNNEE